MKPVRLLLLLALAPGALLAASSPALAAPIVTFTFQGVVTESTANAGLFGMPGTVNVGDPFSGEFSYDRGPGNPDQLPADAELGVYDLLSFTIDQSVLPLTPFAAAVRHIPPILTLPPLPPDPGTDAFSVRSAPLPGYPNGVSLRLEAPFGAVFSDDSLPADLQLSSFTLSAQVLGIVAVGIFPVPSIGDVGQLTSLVRVPEPGLLPLFVLAAAHSQPPFSRRAAEEPRSGPALGRGSPPHVRWPPGLAPVPTDKPDKRVNRPRVAGGLTAAARGSLAIEDLESRAQEASQNETEAARGAMPRPRRSERNRHCASSTRDRKETRLCGRARPHPGSRHDRGDSLLFPALPAERLRRVGG